MHFKITKESQQNFRQNIFSEMKACTVHVVTGFLELSWRAIVSLACILAAGGVHSCQVARN